MRRWRRACSTSSTGCAACSTSTPTRSAIAAALSRRSTPEAAAAQAPGPAPAERLGRLRDRGARDPRATGQRRRRAHVRARHRAALRRRRCRTNTPRTGCCTCSRRPRRWPMPTSPTIGITRTRADTVRTIARAVLDGRVDFRVERTLEEFVARWTALPGIGPWTAQYIALRALGHPDAFPAEDLVLQKAVPTDGTRMTAKALTARAEAWRPWRGYATLHLWRDSMAAPLPKPVAAARTRKKASRRSETPHHVDSREARPRASGKTAKTIHDAAFETHPQPGRPVAAGRRRHPPARDLVQHRRAIRCRAASRMPRRRQRRAARNPHATRRLFRRQAPQTSTCRCVRSARRSSARCGRRSNTSRTARPGATATSRAASASRPRCARWARRTDAIRSRSCVPCHRVIGADGSLTGFGGGLPTKQFLLELEGALPARDLFAANA